jgi:DNA-binding response OmpR family regulator
MQEHQWRILLVDDDEDDYIITEDILSEIEEDSFDLDWVATYEAALEAMARNQHDLYLIDYHLGANNGLELLRKAAVNKRQTPIILLTGLVNEKVGVEAVQAGAADYLVKDQLDALSLAHSIRRAIRLRAKDKKIKPND